MTLLGVSGNHFIYFFPRAPRGGYSCYFADEETEALAVSQSTQGYSRGGVAALEALLLCF